MTKQEKIAVKNSLMTIKESLFSDAWDEIVSDHPYVLQDDDDIEDDFIAQEDNPQEDNAVLRGKMKMEKRKDYVGGRFGIEPYIDKLKDKWGLGGDALDPIDGVAIGEEEGLGFYMYNSQLFVRPFSSYDMAMVITSDSDEQEYLKSLGYTNISELFTKQNSNN
jgi:hypothetical protein